MRISRLVLKSAIIMVLCLAGWARLGSASADPTFTTVHSFKGVDGASPYAGLILDASGAFYGTTSQGGATNASCPGGCGTVFKLTPPTTKGGTWTESVLHSFTSKDGAEPYAGLIFDESGALYGTTSRGGAKSAGCPEGCGTVFKLTPPATRNGAWTESVLHSFMRKDGAYPRAGLIFDKSGALYGTTQYGGAHDNGTVFKLTPPTREDGVWTESVLHSFSFTQDGAQPIAGLVFDKSGALYGTVIGGGPYFGAVFKLAPPAAKGGAWIATLLHSFTRKDGDYPRAGLLFDESGALYGTTQYGGAHYHGTVFKLTPPTRGGGAWTGSVLYSFALRSNDGGEPYAGVTFDISGALYGTTNRGGAKNATCPTAACGTVFKLIPPAAKRGAWTESVLHSFDFTTDGAVPAAGLIFDQSGDALYGTTTEGGISGRGTVFKLTLRTQEVDGGAAGD